MATSLMYPLKFLNRKKSSAPSMLVLIRTSTMAARTKNLKFQPSRNVNRPSADFAKEGFSGACITVTVHGVVDAFGEMLHPRDVENCLHNLLQVSLNDTFGEISMEKEGDKWVSHTPEEKPSGTSYLVLHIIARNIGRSCLLDLRMPFKDLLAHLKSRKMVLKIRECFSKIESIAELLPGPKLSEQEKKQMFLARSHCFILPPTPRMRSGAVNRLVKSNYQADAQYSIDAILKLMLRTQKAYEHNAKSFAKISESDKSLESIRNMQYARIDKLLACHYKCIEKLLEAADYSQLTSSAYLKFASDRILITE
uniref:U3 small nucleolar RNA-associated protein 20 domain-containing protein n=1 Tax=Glossina austeni TaxID=7395 RepID=A0A1A9VB58_GLOAU